MFFVQFVFNVASLACIIEKCSLMCGRAIHQWILFIAPTVLSAQMRSAKMVVQIAITLDDPEVIVPGHVQQLTGLIGLSIGHRSAAGQLSSLSSRTRSSAIADKPGDAVL